MTDPSSLSHEIERALEKITPGKWHAPGLGEVHSDHDNGIYAGVAADGENDPVIADGCSDENADFIAKAPDLLRRALAALQQQGWRDISTAPKDGTFVLLREPNWKAGAVIGKWFDFEQVIHGALGFWEAHATEVKPTHWMPLPPLPASASEGDTTR